MNERLGETRGDVFIRNDRTFRPAKFLREQRPCFLEQVRTDQRFVALIAGLNHNWRHESGESLLSNGLAANRIDLPPPPESEKRVSEVALTRGLSVPLSVVMPDPVDPPPPPPRVHLRRRVEILLPPDCRPMSPPLSPVFRSWAA